MGGSRFNGRELTRKEADQVAILVTEKVSSGSIAIEPVLALGDKSVFGDVDFVVRGRLSEVEARLTKELNPTDMVVNNVNTKSPQRKKVTHLTNNVNCLCDSIQLDFFVTEDQQVYEFLKTYHAYSSGMLIGKVARTLGLRYGQDGLYFIEDDDSATLITRSPWYALSLLGYNHSTLSQGFKNKEHLFDFIAKSKLFNSTLVLEQEAEIGNEVKKQQRYTDFFEFCRTVAAPSFNLDVKASVRAFLFADQNFMKSRDLQREKADKSIAKSSFNGKMVAEITGFTGTELSSFMTHLKSKYEQLNVRLSELPEEDLKTLVVEEALSFNEVSESKAEIEAVTGSESAVESEELNAITKEKSNGDKEDEKSKGST